jgi:hypothetical protein
MNKFSDSLLWKKFIDFINPWLNKSGQISYIYEIHEWINVCVILHNFLIYCSWLFGSYFINSKLYMFLHLHVLIFF